MKEGPGVFRSFDHRYRWTYDMMKRNNLSIRRKTHNANHYFEEEMGSIHLDYVKHVGDLIEKHHLDLYGYQHG